MSRLDGISEVLLPRSLAEKTQLFLRHVGQTGNEGMVLWVGQAQGHIFRITNILIPRQHAIRRADGVCVVVDPGEMLRINMELFHSGLRLIAQVHSHPREAFHSAMDDEEAIANTIGCLSLVVPDFAARDFDLSDCAIYRLKEDGAWNKVTLARAKRLIELIDA